MLFGVFNLRLASKYCLFNKFVICDIIPVSFFWLVNESVGMLSNIISAVKYFTLAKSGIKLMLSMFVGHRHRTVKCHFGHLIQC